VDLPATQSGRWELRRVADAAVGESASVTRLATFLKVDTAVISTVDGLLGLQADYERLLRLMGNTLPFALHDWHVAWCRHFLSATKHIQDRPMIYVVRTRTGACVAIIPMILTRRVLGPFAIRTLEMLGADQAITEIRRPLIEPGYETIAAEAMQRELAAQRNWDWVQWNGISGTFGSSMAAVAKLAWGYTVPDFVLDLPSTWEELRAGLKRNIRESLRHCYNSLKRDGLEFNLNVVTRPEDLTAALDRFLSLHAARANFAGAKPHDNHFATKVSRDFLHEVCSGLAPRAVVRVFELVIGGEVVASRIGFVVGDSLYLYYSGFDPCWEKYSVMTTTMAEAIKYAIAAGLRTVNLSTTKDTAKTRWGPREVPFASAVQTSRRLRSRLAHRVYSHTRAGGPFATWVVRLIGTAKRRW
jgi:CelD/BcsL family acetyltransferase involved in cellulose biosynthesis